MSFKNEIIFLKYLLNVFVKKKKQRKRKLNKEKEGEEKRKKEKDTRFCMINNTSHFHIIIFILFVLFVTTWHVS